MIYANPFSTDQTKLKLVSNFYIYPFFDQNWNLFVPTPHHNYKLIVTYNEKGNHTIDILQDAINRQRSNPALVGESVVLSVVSCIHYFDYSVSMSKKLNGPQKNNRYFKMIEYEVNGYLNNILNVRPSEQKICLHIEDLSENSNSVFYN